MSPKKKNKFQDNCLALDPIEINGNESYSTTSSYDVDPQHLDSLESHIKQSVGGSLVSVAL